MKYPSYFHIVIQLYARFARRRAGIMRLFARSDISANEVSHFHTLSKHKINVYFFILYIFSSRLSDFGIYEKTAEKNIQFYENDSAGLFHLQPAFFQLQLQPAFSNFNFNRLFSQTER